MDIRNFLRKRTVVESNANERTAVSENSKKARTNTSDSEGNVENLAGGENSNNTFVSESDIGLYVRSSTTLNDTKKLDLLTNCYEPSETYDFKADATGPSQRCFRLAWLSTYSPWLSYSKHLKGALCKHCVLFPQPVGRGVQGSFIVTPFNKY